MLTFLLYKTPRKFFDEFDDHYSFANLKQVRIISSLIFILSGFVRIAATFLHEQLSQLEYFEELSYANWSQLFGSFIFFVVSSYALNPRKSTKKQRKLLVLIFVLYTLTMSFSVTYILSLHNAKNMLTMFLLGIVIVSLFFALEFKSIAKAVVFILFIYFAALVVPTISHGEKIINSVAAIILAISLFTFSRYGYYFKSKHFIRIKQLEEKNHEILHLNSQKGEMLSFVAHDLRAPLNNIEAIGNLMLMDNEDHDEAKIIVNATLKAKRIIDDLIEAAKQERQVLSTKDIRLGEFINELLAKWHANTTRKITLVTEDADIALKANPVKLERAIDNLISNAVKFSENDKPINITVAKTDDTVIIKVSDLGIGIPVNLQTHIFEQFSVAGRQGLQGEKSVGLGLHISHKIIEQHRGTLLMESVENQGTTFTIALPLETA